MADMPGDVHVMPHDGKHTPSVACHCKPQEDEQTKRLRAQGLPSDRVIVHQRLG